jgi:hypothetical protein
MDLRSPVSVPQNGSHSTLTALDRLAINGGRPNAYKDKVSARFRTTDWEELMLAGNTCSLTSCFLSGGSQLGCDSADAL